MWAKGLLLLLLVVWEVRLGACSLTDILRRNTQAQQNADIALLRSRVEELSELIQAFLSHLTDATVPTGCRAPYVNIGERCIVVLDKKQGSWAQMRSHCRDIGGELIKMDDANLMAEVVQYIHDNNFNAHRYWIGASDLGHEGTWRWPDGHPVSMGTPFWGDYGSNQEPGGGLGEGCANMPRDDHFFFHDGPCAEVNSAICEY